jgi:hypothetical protein
VDIAARRHSSQRREGIEVDGRNEYSSPQSVQRLVIGVVLTSAWCSSNQRSSSIHGGS